MAWRLQCRPENNASIAGSEHGFDCFDSAEKPLSAFSRINTVDRPRNQRRWTEKYLASLRKGGLGKVALARERRSRTTVPLSWIAERLKMGSRGYLTWLLQRQIKPDDKQRAFDLS